MEEALSRIEVGFRTMKFFGSKEGEPLEQCLSKLRQCNYYVGIIGHRYGTLHDVHKKSITELEYEEAKHLRMKIRIYFADSTVGLNAELIEPDTNRSQLKSFKERLKRENAIVYFSSPDDLATKVLADIHMSAREKRGDHRIPNR